MDATKMRELADALAASAVSGDTTPLQKIALDLGNIKEHLAGAAANPHLRNALLGAGAGGLLGLATGRDKKRDAMHYALMGGLGGLGLSAGAQMMQKATAPAPKALEAPISSNPSPALKGVGMGLGAAGATLAAGAAPIAASRASRAAVRGAVRAARQFPGPARKL